METGGKKNTRKLFIGYSSGDLTISIPLSVVMFFQLYFLTDIAGLSPGLAGWALLIGKFWDAVNDPIIGSFTDSVRHPMGRRRVLIAGGIIPLSLFFFLLWIVPPFSQYLKAVYYALMIILFDTAFTCVHVGYNSLTPELTSDYDERSTLNGWRMTFQLIGSLGAIAGLTLLGRVIPDPAGQYAAGAGIMAVICCIPMFAVLKLTKPFDNSPPSAMTVRDGVLETLRSKPFRLLVGMYLFSWTTASLMSAILIYFVSYYLRMPESANYVVLAAQAGAILFIPLTVYLCRRFEKTIAFVIGSMSWIIALLGVFFVTPEHGIYALPLALACGLGIATAYVVPWSMLADIIEYDQQKTGCRREGSYYAFASFFQKMGTAGALWITGQVMEFTGYISPTASLPAPVQPESALRAIRIFMGPVPAVLLCGAIFLSIRFPISRESHRKLVEKLSADKSGVLPMETETEFD